MLARDLLFERLPELPDDNPTVAWTYMSHRSSKNRAMTRGNDSRWLVHNNRRAGYLHNRLWGGHKHWLIVASHPLCLGRACEQYYRNKSEMHEQEAFHNGLHKIKDELKAQAQS